ncbi:non-hydrolyzing UDP-N-acetylglucosamine 2-epimerase [Methanococcus voltae]|uniref:UDP-N-acetylglucosamine 2-epimerase n=1 Tax=Methanococcus voltae (strain ATCC BAA-1334 / A3) TaxID=456320 RepID=D7DRY2_METV3|nr:UDP-N-acetylglucosamine 2-epimerase (non-hydrolyzing) [Methanococcus voltae]MCS3901417.1 UDP-N-acetylglucosamine 2-epimerase (non-hydrolyzing) [Methanococcus voltae]
MKILTVVGARPQFIKLAPVSKELRKNHDEILVDTGQHYDYEMNKIFFEQLNIPKPDYYLGVGSGNHGHQTGEMLKKIEDVLLNEKPDLLIVYGDTNSTLAGALAASKLHIKVAHIEAGLRSFDRRMPEELNRITTDHLSDLLFVPTKTGVDNLKVEGVSKGVYLTGDVMYDAVLNNLEIAENKIGVSKLFDDLGLKNHECKQYMLATIHRAENTNDKEKLTNIFEAMMESNENIVLPLHPRTEKYLKEYGLYDKVQKSNITIIKPVGYLEMLLLEKYAKKILTDSGGVQKEAYFVDVPCITLRENTEWIETLEDGYNVLVGSNKDEILKNIKEFEINKNSKTNRFGDGNASKVIAEIISRY